MNHFSLVVDNDGIALINFDRQGRSVNVLSDDVQNEIDQIIETLKTRDDIRGAVLTSAKASSFCVGADLGEFTGYFDTWRAADDESALAAGLAHSSHLSRQLRALETCGKPVAAAINGMALGGGLELALACHYRVAVNDPKLRLAFPEIGVGLLPGAGGTQRLLRLMGISQSLPYLLDGSPISLDVALQSGVINEQAPAEELIARARRWVLANPDAVAPWDVKDFRIPGGGPHEAVGIREFGPAIATRLADDGPCYPARGNVLKCVYEGSQVPIDAGLAIESWHFFNTLRTPQAKAMARAFFSTRQTLTKRAAREDSGAYLECLRQAVRQQLDAIYSEGAGSTLLQTLARRVAVSDIDLPGSDAKVRVADVDFAEVARLRERLLVAQVVAAFQALEQGLIGDVLEADDSALRAGFPAWTGGPLSYAHFDGLAAFVARADALAADHGQAFVLPESVKQRAAAVAGYYQ